MTAWTFAGSPGNLVNPICMCDATYVQDGMTFLFTVFFSYMQIDGKKYFKWTFD
jgi:hypothetical protein